MSPKPPIKPTYSVQTAVDELSAEKEPSSWHLVQNLLKHHSEYGGHKGEQMAAGGGPSEPARKSATQWLEEVSALFDREMVHELHGRLLILGLSQLDPSLRDYLNRQDFLRTLTDELKEDFDSLLLPTHAGDHAYRGKFMKLLQNKPVNKEKPRQKGFIVVALGGPGLQGLAELCHRQTWNSPFTARYVVGPHDGFTDALSQFMSDLGSLKRGDQTTVGDLLPDPATDLERWRKEVAGAIVPGPEALSILGVGHSGEQFLSVGTRLVLLIEFRRVPDGVPAERVALTQQVVESLHALPERVGIVLSGLPESVTSVLSSLEMTNLDLPLDREHTRGQALANDVPVGPDRLNILGEVNALAEAIALNDMKPPMVVGVMGGWGAGKSFVLHLIENRIQEIRCEPVDEEKDPSESDFPFVGHPYLIRFDAWTYAKGNLWASLMQQIFVELDRQVGLEQTLAKKLPKELGEGRGNEVWRVLSRLTGEQQDRLLKTDLGKKALNIVAQFDRGQIAESRLWEVLEKLKEKEIDRLHSAEGEMEQMRSKRDQARLELQHAVDSKIERDARRSAWIAVGDEFLEKAWKNWSDRPDKTKSQEEREPPTFAQVQESVRWYEKLYKERSSTAVALILFALAGGILAVIANMPGGLGAGFTGAMGVVGSVWTGLTRFRSWATAAAKRFEEATAANRRFSEEMREELVDNAVRLVKTSGVGEVPPEIAEKAHEFGQFDDGFEAKKAEVETRRQRVGMAARHENLVDFVRQRLEGRFYEDKLGLLHQVKSDLEDLSDALLRRDSTHDLFPRGKPRIILLIDDLDRCPPNKVVEVLEAAQLLVKTPLFVVVLAMDVRYITRALEKVYAGVLVRWGMPSGLDYIEKIIQIPYRVRPVSEPAVSSFLWSQMSPEKPVAGSESRLAAPPGAASATQPAVPEPGSPGEPPEKTKLKEGEESRTPSAHPYQSELRVLPTKTLQFSINDHELISACCASFEVSPRTMKRLVNVFKLLKIIWFRQGLDEGPETDVKKAMLALLVIAARFPEPMRQLLHTMERKYADPQSESATEIVPFLVEHCMKNRNNALVPQDWNEVEAALNNPALISQDLSFEQLHERHLHLVSTFSFIGESDPEREATLTRDLYRPLMVASEEHLEQEESREGNDGDATGEPHAGP